MNTCIRKKNLCERDIRLQLKLVCKFPTKQSFISKHCFLEHSVWSISRFLKLCWSWDKANLRDWQWNSSILLSSSRWLFTSQTCFLNFQYTTVKNKCETENKCTPKNLPKSQKCWFLVTLNDHILSFNWRSFCLSPWCLRKVRLDITKQRPIILIRCCNFFQKSEKSNWGREEE